MQVIAQIRAFNRFYVRQIGLFDDVVPGDMSLTEARLLYEIGADGPVQAKGLAELLDLDEGYVSRMLKRLEGLGLIGRRPSPEDGRVKVLRLTEAGRARHASLDNRAEGAVARMLGDMDRPTQALLIEAMSTIEGILGEARADDVTLRVFGTGDVGWLIKRYGELFASEGGFDLSFEALVARIAGGILEDGPQPGRTGWVAVRGGARLGGILYTEEDETTGRLRTLIVEPSARGLGIGQRLVDQVIAHARQRGKAKLVLWTEKGLEAAVRLYERTGFRLMDEVTEEDFGRVMVNQTWELDLAGGDQPRPA